MHHDPHSSTRVLIYIHHLPYQNSTSRYLDCRHNNSGHPQTTCTSTPDSTTFTPHLHFFFYFSSSSHPSSPQTPSQSPPLSRENRLYTSIPFSQVQHRSMSVKTSPKCAWWGVIVIITLRTDIAVSFVVVREWWTLLLRSRSSRDDPDKLLLISAFF